jgi:inner membrane protein
MASIFGHVAASTALGYAFFPKAVRPATIILAGFCAFAPDLDVLAFRFDIPYESQWGHRGWTHSIVFALVFGAIVTFIFQYIQKNKINLTPLLLWCVLSTLSHPLLDMLTNGGRGCALWWPFLQERIFFPLRPIQVSPLGAGAFFSEWGLRVLWSEMVWIGLPALGIVILARKILTLK